MLSAKNLILSVVLSAPFMTMTAQAGPDPDRKENWHIELDEITVRRNKEHYTKKNNPAVDLMNAIREGGRLTDPFRNDNYNYSQYDCIGIALNNIDVDNSGVVSRFPFLKEYVDTSDVTGRPILPISVKEKASSTYARLNPRARKQYVTGLTNAGIDEIVDQENMQILLDDILREVDIYEADINILQNRFVSPLSPLAADFYKFYLGDTLMVDNVRCVRLSFVPRNNRTFGFTGSIFAAVDDSTHFVKKVTMNVAKAINLNFIDYLSLTQTYDRAPDGSRLKMSDDMVAEVSVIKGTQGLHVSRRSTYGAHNFYPSPHPELFSRRENVIISPGAYVRDEAFWGGVSADSHGTSAAEVSLMMGRLRQSPVYYWCEKALKILVSGYVNTGNPSKFDFGPVNTLFSSDYIEGARFRLGGMTTANLNPRWFGRAYVAYGTKDRKLKYKGEIEYSFNDKQYHSREFAMHSLRLTHQYDVDRVGQHYLYSNMDNFFLSLKRMKDRMMLYERLTKLEYTYESGNHFSVLATAFHRRYESTEYVPFVLSDGSSAGHYQQSGLTLQLRYAPGEKYYQTKSDRIPINLDAPVIQLTHTFSPGDILGNRFTINRTELSAQKRFWFSAWGFADILVKGGHIWSTVPYNELLMPNVNLSYTIQPESFALLSPLEFVNDTYACWFVTYWANGAIFNYIPLLRSLKLREVFSFNGTIGTLSSRNDPARGADTFLFPEGTMSVRMHGTPYMEMSAGIDNLLKCLRVDYVWRLNYRNTPGTDRGGVRVAFHVTF